MEISIDWGDGTPHWDKPPAVAQKFIEYIDPSVAASLPSAVKPRDIIGHGKSFWTRTAQIVTLRDDGREESFFLKVSTGDDGRGMMHGEYESMKALYAIDPELVPEPIAWSTYATDGDVHFFLCAFVHMDQTRALCAADDLAGRLVRLHRASQRSPPPAETTETTKAQKFGFHVATYQGRRRQDPTWCDTWEGCFARNLDAMFEHEAAANGPADEEMAALRAAVATRVVPRLLRPMETGGRRVVPTLIHGDLWEGNTGTDSETGIPKIFDACSWYAHHEFEMAPWRPIRQQMRDEYVKAYLEQHAKEGGDGRSEPVEDFDGRNALYALVRLDMRELVSRYPETFEEWQDRHA
ncbi:Fructosamine kinase-domain-containing protein [Xylariomycetidae sp. FL2044]|nr:Fructosamine kinase-domain-containing protein [Xylariomycetidae sp. FL2044]